MLVNYKFSIIVVILYIISSSYASAGIPSLPVNMIYNPETGILSTNNQPVKGLYDIDTLQTIYLEFSQPNWWQLLTQKCQDKKDIPADLIYDGARYNNVGIRFRGQTWYQSQGAEHEIYIYHVQQELLAGSDLVINEVMAANTKTIADPQGEYDDWIELYNKGSKTISLAGMYLSDKVDNLKKWQFPDNTLMKAGEYLIIWADENGKATPGIHTNFKLSASGEGLFLTSSDETGNLLIDSISFGQQEDDISFGRYPNGTGEFRKMDPSPGAENNGGVDVQFEVWSDNISDIEVYPNPFSSSVNIAIQNINNQNTRISIIDKLGTLVKEYEIDNPGSSNVNIIWDGTDHGNRILPSGAYQIIIRIGNKLLNKSVILIR